MVNIFFQTHRLFSLPETHLFFCEPYELKLAEILVYKGLKSAVKILSCTEHYFAYYETFLLRLQIKSKCTCDKSKKKP